MGVGKAECRVEAGRAGKMALMQQGACAANCDFPTGAGYRGRIADAYGAKLVVACSVKYMNTRGGVRCSEPPEGPRTREIGSSSESYKQDARASEDRSVGLGRRSYVRFLLCCCAVTTSTNFVELSVDGCCTINNKRTLHFQVTHTGTRH